MNLDLIRKEIDDIDKSIVELLEKRFDIVELVAEFKRKSGKEVKDSKREAQVIQKNIELLGNPELSPLIERVFTVIFEESRNMQKKLLNIDDESKRKIIGYQGTEGSYSQEAAINFFSEDNAMKSYKEFEDVFKAIESGEINYGVLPIENSSTGSINENFDLLNKYGLYIVGEYFLKVDHNLIGIDGTDIEDIETVYSHPQALSQCRDFLNAYEDWNKINYINTAKSVEYVKNQNDKSMVAIGSERAAKIYDMKIIRKNISDIDNNTTRFAIIGSEIESKNQNDKISVVLTTMHKSGSLYKVIECFSRYDINMLKIESRPIRGKKWEYFFFVDFEGNIMDDKIKEALREIKENSIYFKVIGNYLKGQKEDEK